MEDLSAQISLLGLRHALWVNKYRKYKGVNFSLLIKELTFTLSSVNKYKSNVKDNKIFSTFRKLKKIKNNFWNTVIP